MARETIWFSLPSSVVAVLRFLVRLAVAIGLHLQSGAGQEVNDIPRRLGNGRRHLKPEESLDVMDRSSSNHSIHSISSNRMTSLVVQDPLKVTNRIPSCPTIENRLVLVQRPQPIIVVLEVRPTTRKRSARNRVVVTRIRTTHVQPGLESINLDGLDVPRLTVHVAVKTIPNNVGMTTTLTRNL